MAFFEKHDMQKAKLTAELTNDLEKAMDSALQGLPLNHAELLTMIQKELENIDDPLFYADMLVESFVQKIKSKNGEVFTPMFARQLGQYGSELSAQWTYEQVRNLGNLPDLSNAFYQTLSYLF